MLSVLPCKALGCSEAIPAALTFRQELTALLLQ